jgi:hypothetical protein
VRILPPQFLSIFKIVLQIVTVRDGIWMPKWYKDDDTYSGRQLREITSTFVNHSRHSQSLILCQSLALGRPPSIRLSYVDCELPEDHEATVDKDGKTLVGCASALLLFFFLAKITDCLLLDYRWKYEFIKDIVSTILEQTLTAEAPQYRTILELDRKIREKVLPPHLNVFMNPEEERFTPSVYMRSCILGQLRAVSGCLSLFLRFVDFVSDSTL